MIVNGYKKVTNKNQFSCLTAGGASSPTYIEYASINDAENDINKITIEVSNYICDWKDNSKVTIKIW